VNRNFASSGKYAPATNRIAGGCHITDAPQLLFSRPFCRAIVSILILLTVSVPQLRAQQPTETLELSRPVRSWEFLPVGGTRAGLFGNESGHLEAWVYPLKIFRDFQLTFHVGGRALPAESLVRRLTVRPEFAILLYAGDSFRVRETLFVPVHESAP